MYQCQSLSFNKVAGLRSTTLLKKRLWHRCFPAEFCEISKNTFSTKHLRTTASGLAMFYLDQMEIVCSAQHNCHWYERLLTGASCRSDGIRRATCKCNILCSTSVLKSVFEKVNQYVIADR